MRILRARLLAGRPGRGRRRGVGRPALPGAHRRPLRADPHLQLPGEPDLRPPHRLQVLQPRPGARRRPRGGHHLVRRGRPRRPARGARGGPPVEDARRRLPPRGGADRDGWPRRGAQPGLRRRRAAGARARHHPVAGLVDDVPTERRRTTPWWPSRRGASRCSTSPGSPGSGTSSWRSGPVSSRRAPRPSCSPGGRSRRRRDPLERRRSWSTCAPAPGRSRWRSPRGARRRRARRGAGRGRARWAARNLAGSGVDLRQGDLADAFPTSTARSTWCCATRPTSRSRPSSPSPRRRATTTRTWRCSPATTGWTRSGCSSGSPRGCCARRRGGRRARRRAGGVRPAVFAASGRWADVRDHRDLAGRPRYLTARLAR